MPFENVFLHGLIRDEHQPQDEQSRGNGIDPLDWVELFGADALRFTLARGASPGGDSPSVRPRPRLAQLRDQAVQRHPVRTHERCRTGPAARRTSPDADRWILGRLEQVRADVDAADAYEFSRACEALYHFAWDEFCDWYLELAKVQLGREATRSQCYHRRCSRPSSTPC